MINYRKKRVTVFVISLISFAILCSAALPVTEGEVTTMIISKNIYQRGRLTTRPNKAVVNDNVITGLRPLGLTDERDGLIYVPETYTENNPASLALMLHGAGGNADHGMMYIKNYADDHNIILVSPASRARSWDIITQDAFGRDVIFIDEVLTFTFKHYFIDPSHIAIGGFSDGASYALSIGLTNGDLFTHIMAFSPGFLYTSERNGRPAVFISHGTSDPVLPIYACSRRIVSQLQQESLTVNYQEFDGEHTVPSGIAEDAVEWFTRKDAPS